jgi:hypothetical protein
MMTQPDSCRPVALPSGETVLVRARGGLGPVGVAALAEVVEAARAKHAAEHPPDPGAGELYGRVDAVCKRLGMPRYQAAKAIGVRHSVLVRLAQGRLPCGGDRTALEAWLESQESAEPDVTSTACAD